MALSSPFFSLFLDHILTFALFVGHCWTRKHMTYSEYKAQVLVQQQYYLRRHDLVN